MNKQALINVKLAITDRLSKVGEIRTAEVVSICHKQHLELDYKTIGTAFRRIVEELEFAGAAYKVRLGVWYINDPIKPVKPIEVENEIVVSNDLTLRCESAYEALVSGGKINEITILRATDNAGVSISAFNNYLSRRKKDGLRC